MKWTPVGTVESASDPGRLHEIKESSAGALGCSCLSYRFAKGPDKTCRHIIAYRSGAAVSAPQTVSVSSERFTVTRRRAISLTGAL